MTRRATDVMGKPIVSAETGRKLGTVADLLLDENRGTLVGLLVRHGMFRGEHVLPAESVMSFGADAVVSRSDELIGPKEWSDRKSSPSRDTDRDAHASE